MGLVVSCRTGKSIPSVEHGRYTEEVTLKHLLYEASLARHQNVVCFQGQYCALASPCPWMHTIFRYRTRLCPITVYHWTAINQTGLSISMQEGILMIPKNQLILNVSIYCRTGSFCCRKNILISIYCLMGSF